MTRKLDNDEKFEKIGLRVKVLKPGGWYTWVNNVGAHQFESGGRATCGERIPENHMTWEIAPGYPEHKKCPDCRVISETGSSYLDRVMKQADNERME